MAPEFAPPLSTVKFMAVVPVPAILAPSQPLELPPGGTAACVPIVAEKPPATDVADNVVSKFSEYDVVVRITAAGAVHTIKPNAAAAPPRSLPNVVNFIRLSLQNKNCQACKFEVAHIVASA